MNFTFYKCIMILTALLWTSKAQCQSDTLHLNFKEAEKLFLANNLQLLAQRYNVDASQALAQQAKLWDNPVISIQQNITDKSAKFFQHGRNAGNVVIQLSQLIQTAGKREKKISVANDDQAIKQAAFDDMMRKLRFNLLLDLAQTANLIEQTKVYQMEIASASSLVNTAERAYHNGNNSFKNIIRLKALLFGLQNDLVGIDRQINDLQSELRILLTADSSQYIYPAITLKNRDTALNIPSLIEQAKTLRGDYLINYYSFEQGKNNLKLQKALAVPDVTLGPVYDQRGNYAPAYWGLQVSLPLPILNRNQGNIKSARLMVQSQNLLLKANALTLQNEIYTAYKQYRLAQRMLGKAETDFYDNYDKLYLGMSNAFQMKQINLQEFVDFFDAYRDTKIKILQQQFNLQKAIADLNFAAGTTVISPL